MSKAPKRPAAPKLPHSASKVRSILLGSAGFFGIQPALCASAVAKAKATKPKEK